jgi:hypothetical protein
VVARLEVEVASLSLLAQYHRVLLGHPFGRVGIGQVGQGRGNALQIGVDLLELSLAGLDRLLQLGDGGHLLLRPLPALLGLADLLGDRLALGLGALDLRQQLAATGVEREQLVDLLGGATARKRRLDPLRVGADQLKVKHGPEG